MQLRLRDNVDTVNTISPYPAAGKGTINKSLKLELAHQRLVGHVDVGEIIRSHKKEGTLIGLAADDFQARGLMVPDEIIVPEIRRNIKALDPESLWLLDGFPRIRLQIDPYKQLMEQLGRTDKFVYLNVPREIAEERMVKRGQVAIAERRKPREDDVNPDVRKTRLNIAQEEMKHVIDFAGESGKLIEVDASGSVGEVQTAVWAQLFEQDHAMDFQVHHNGIKILGRGTATTGASLK